MTQDLAIATLEPNIVCPFRTLQEILRDDPVNGANPSGHGSDDDHHCRNRGNAVKVAIASGKGGTGKTTVATNLAAYLATTEPVVLVDMDVEEPNSGLFVSGRLHHRETKSKQIPEWQAERCTLCGLC